MTGASPSPNSTRPGPWVRRAIAASAGALSVLAMAPFFAWPVLFLTLPVLVYLIDAARDGAVRRPHAQAAAITWLFGFGYFLAGLFWIGEAFLVEADKFAALMPFAVMAMPAGLALFWAAAAAAASVVWCPGPGRVVVLAIALTVAEWLRGHILTGFPWNVLGYALTAPETLMQSASVFGIYGLTLVTVVTLGLPGVVLADRWSAGSGPGRPSMRGVVLAASGSILALVVMTGWGSYRLSGVPPPANAAVRMRLVQPSIPQRHKWQVEKQADNFRSHLELSRRNAAGVVDDAREVDLIVWPEAAMPFLPLDTPGALEAIGSIVPEGAFLAAGLLRVEAVPPGMPGRRRRVLNSLAAFDADGRPVAVYDKTHLVPFGEYLPFQQTLESIGLEQLTRIRGGFDVGPTPRPLMRIGGLPPLAPLICYEAIFPGTVVQSKERPAALLNVTNDGWFGNTTGPRQHLHQARVRAVEEGIPVIRSANNGISAVVDAHGRIVARLDLDVAGTVDVTLPGVLAPPVYARFGDGLLLVMLVLSIAVLLRQRPSIDEGDEGHSGRSE